MLKNRALHLLKIAVMDHLWSKSKKDSWEIVPSVQVIMAFPRVSQEMPPTIEPDKAPLAYGLRTVPKLNEDLLSTDVKLRQQTLGSLCDVLHDPQLVTQAIKEGCVANLKCLLPDSDAVVREKTTEAFAILALSDIGSMACLKGDVIVPLSHIFEDDFTACRLNAHLVVKRLSKTPQGAVAIMNAGLIAKLVDLMKHSSAKVCKEALDTLHYCLIVDIKKPLLASEITLFKSLFAHEDHVVRAKAARNIMDASVCQEGVTEAIQQGIVPALVEMLADIELEVRACSAGAIMMLGVNIEVVYKKIVGNSNKDPQNVRSKSPVKEWPTSQSANGRSHSHDVTPVTGIVQKRPIRQWMSGKNDLSVCLRVFAAVFATSDVDFPFQSN
uniref:radial spoke head 14 homolog n=1 Tax=Myxine glutinosa TaxID=7769 RepID=UPI00358F50BE